MDDGIEVRVGSEDDAELAAGIHRASALEAFAHIFPADAPAPMLDDLVKEWRERLGRTGVRLFVAHLDGEPVGVVVTLGDVADRRAGELSRLYVLPEAWSRGVGSRLYATAMWDLRHRDVRRVRLWVLEGNTRAREWYERLGWTCTHETKGNPPTDVLDVQYVLDL